MSVDLLSFSKTSKNRFRWDAIPMGAMIEEHQIHPRWVDLFWWDDSRQLWVYVATKPKADERKYEGSNP